MVQNIDFKRKTSGVQVGLIAEIYLEKENSQEKLSCKYHIKTHQNGMTRSEYERSSIDLRELFLYKFFQFISIGPEVHFYYDDFNGWNVFIASCDLGQDFLTLKELEERNLIEEFETNTYLKAVFLMADFFAKLLFLSDITTNASNLGILKQNCVSSIKIVDFYNKTEELLKSHLDGYDFYKTFFEISSSSLSSKGVLSKYFQKLDKATRTTFACKILKDFDIKQSLDEASK